MLVIGPDSAGNLHDVVVLVLADDRMIVIVAGDDGLGDDGVREVRSTRRGGAVSGVIELWRFPYLHEPRLKLDDTGTGGS